MKNNLLDFNNWQETIKKTSCYLLEDNQLMSLPTIVLHNGKKCFFTFVFSINVDNNTISVLQHHFWGDSEHEMSLCKHDYKIDRVDLLILNNVEYQKKYFNKLSSIYEFAFQNALSKKTLVAIYDYIDIIKISGTMLDVNKKENPNFFAWVQSVNYWGDF